MLLLLTKEKHCAAMCSLKRPHRKDCSRYKHWKFAATEIDATHLHLLPGAIDDQVHFREPGLTHKATIYTEAKAAVAGGVTSFMEMPNTVPPAFTQELLENKYAIASKSALANYSFFMGTSNDNLEEVKNQRQETGRMRCKIFMGSSTGNLLVDNPLALENIFASAELLIATHCEDEKIIRDNFERLKREKGVLEPSDHPIIRNEENCFESSSKPYNTPKHNARLHILHISTEKELQLFGNMARWKTNALPLKCVFTTCILQAMIMPDLATRSNVTRQSRHRITGRPFGRLLLDDRLDVIATDHAPHTWEEKMSLMKSSCGTTACATFPAAYVALCKRRQAICWESSGKMSHAVATCFQVRERGYIREGYHADLVLVDMHRPTTVSKENILLNAGGARWKALYSRQQ